MRFDQRVSRQQFLKLLAATAFLTVTATAIATIAAVPTAALVVGDYVGRRIRHAIRVSTTGVENVVEFPLRATGIRRPSWSPTYDDAEVFARAGVSRQIKVDQVGYRTNDVKVAKLTTAGGAFSVVDASTGQEVFRGRSALRAHQDAASGDTVYDLDFSSVTAPGRYYVNVPGVGRSFEFSVHEGIYNVPLSVVIRGFYLQRCGAEVVDNRWGHSACHLSDAKLWGQKWQRIDATGGWHDAGDYGKYVPSATFAVGTLLTAFEFYPDRFGLRTSGRNTRLPDVLAELRWELDWLSRMQAKSGGVYHKVTSTSWDGNTVPPEDRSDRFAFAISTAATASFAAVMAAAARAFTVFDSKFAATARSAAERAWSYLDQNPRIVPPGGFRNPDGVTTGEYSDSDDTDERFWAAAELFRTTGETDYADYVQAKSGRWRSFFSPPPTVSLVQGLGALAYLLAEPAGGDHEIRRRMRDDLIDVATQIVAKARAQAYQVALSPGEYYWGSNGVALNYALVLLFAERFRENPDFAAIAMDQLHYIFGRNSLGKSFVTGIGANPVMRPHHEAVIVEERDPPPPGFLSGGPNAADAGDLARFPARDYVDSSSYFTVNETTIDMNAALAFVLVRFAEPSVR